MLMTDFVSRMGSCRPRTCADSAVLGCNHFDAAAKQRRDRQGDDQDEEVDK